MSAEEKPQPEPIAQTPYETHFRLLADSISDIVVLNSLDLNHVRFESDNSGGLGRAVWVPDLITFHRR